MIPRLLLGGLLCCSVLTAQAHVLRSRSHGAQELSTAGGHGTLRTQLDHQGRNATRTLREGRDLQVYLMVDRPLQYQADRQSKQGAERAGRVAARSLVPSVLRI
jgi:hypothetical protein